MIDLSQYQGEVARSDKAAYFLQVNCQPTIENQLALLEDENARRYTKGASWLMDCLKNPAIVSGVFFEAHQTILFFARKAWLDGE